MKQVPITTIMSREVELLAPNTALSEVVSRMRENRHSCCLIGENGIVAGIITERDLVGILQDIIKQPEIASQNAASIMSSPAHTIESHHTVFDALVIARAERVRHLPVVDQNQQLVGLLTQTDLASAHFHIIEHQSAMIEKAIEARTEELRIANRELQSLSLEDALLSIGNRRAMEVDLGHTHALAKRYRRPYTVALLDIDYFKKYNDHYGHLRGDQALKQIADVVTGTVRKSDRVYRYGGEELLVLLPDTEATGAHVVIERLIRALHETAIEHNGSPFGVVTMSAGYADVRFEDPLTDWHDVIERADQSLYQAKHLGRNRVA